MKKALIVYGGWAGHDPKGVADIFEELLTNEGILVDKSDTLDAFLGDLSKYDLIVPVWTMGSLSGEAEKNVLEAVAMGTGLAGCHGGMCDAFRGNTGWQFMTGAQWVAHPGNSDVTYTVNITDQNSPLTKDIADFTLTSEQYYIHVDPAVKVYATTTFPVADGAHASNGKVDMPVVFTKTWGKGKVYYNSLGHNAKLFDDVPEAKELMRRGFLYALRGE
jgi:type 1 glutamine amidotransferase